MLYNILLLSAVVSALCIHILPSLLKPAPASPITLGRHRAAGLPPCAITQLPASYLFHTWSCVCVNSPINLRSHPILSREFLSGYSQMVSRSSGLPASLPHYQENAGVPSKAGELGCYDAMRCGQCREEAFSSYVAYISTSPTKLWGSMTLGSIWWTAFPLERDRTFLFAVCIKASKSVIYFISSPPHV